MRDATYLHRKSLPWLIRSEMEPKAKQFDAEEVVYGRNRYQIQTPAEISEWESRERLVLQCGEAVAGPVNGSIGQSRAR